MTRRTCTRAWIVAGALALAAALAFAAVPAAQPPADMPARNADAVEAAARYTRQGQALLDRGAASLAISDLEAALELDATHAPAALALGNALVEVGRYGDARRAFTEAIANDPELFTRLERYADALAELGDHPGALTVLDRIIEKEPTQAAALERAGALRVRTGERTRGAEQLARALEVDPTRLGAAVELGFDALRAGDADAALAFFERANAIRINERAAVYGIARALALLGRDGEAATWARRFDAQQEIWKAVDRAAARLRRNPRDVDAYVRLGELHNQLRHFDAASGVLETAIDLDASRVDALRALALADMGRQLFGDAEQALYRALELRPDDPALHRDLAACYRFTGSFELSGQHMARARELEETAAAGRPDSTAHEADREPEMAAPDRR